LFDNARLGHEEIVYRTARAIPAHRTSRLSGAPSDAALRVRVVHRDERTIQQTFNGYATVQSAREHVARDLGADVATLLSSEAVIERRGHDGKPTGHDGICPGHVAVLVRTHATAELVRSELHRAGVPAVITGAGNVFATSAARDWLRLLEAIERPAATMRARTAALTPFLGWTAERVVAASDADWEGVHRRIHGWARILRDSGVAALAEAIATGEDLAARLLSVTDGERRLTDLNHVGQLLRGHGRTTRGHGPAWLAGRAGGGRGPRRGRGGARATA
jgi:exodeoxyribonuclease V beta subunit